MASTRIRIDPRKRCHSAGLTMLKTASYNVSSVLPPGLLHLHRPPWDKRPKPVRSDSPKFHYCGPSVRLQNDLKKLRVKEGWTCVKRVASILLILGREGKLA